MGKKKHDHNILEQLQWEYTNSPWLNDQYNLHQNNRKKKNMIKLKKKNPWKRIKNKSGQKKYYNYYAQNKRFKINIHSLSIQKKKNIKKKEKEHTNYGQ